MKTNTNTNANTNTNVMNTIEGKDIIKVVIKKCHLGWDICDTAQFFLPLSAADVDNLRDDRELWGTGIIKIDKYPARVIDPNREGDLIRCVMDPTTTVKQFIDIWNARQDVIKKYNSLPNYIQYEDRQKFIEENKDYIKPDEIAGRWAREAPQLDEAEKEILNFGCRYEIILPIYKDYRDKIYFNDPRLKIYTPEGHAIHVYNRDRSTNKIYIDNTAPDIMFAYNYDERREFERQSELKAPNGWSTGKLTKKTAAAWFKYVDSYINDFLAWHDQRTNAKAAALKKVIASGYVERGTGTYFKSSGPVTDTVTIREDGHISHKYNLIYSECEKIFNI